MILKNCRIPDFESCIFRSVSINIENEVITQIIQDTGIPDSDSVIDCDGKFISPGLCDGHVHIESSHLCPREFCAQAVRHGTTAVFADPHELTNVFGIDAVEFFIQESEHVPLDLYTGIPSCVPATDLETSGGRITLEDVQNLIRHEQIYGLAEMMNSPGIIFDFGEYRSMVETALEAGKIADGHCPGLSGKDLQTYISNGRLDGTVRIGSDHECTSFEEAREKHAAGMHIMLRHGSASRDLERILPGFAREGIAPERLILVCDDITAGDLSRRGHINYLHFLAREILMDSGLNREEAFLSALRMCTSNTCGYFGIQAGSVCEGKRANLILHSSLDNITPEMVIFRGETVYSKDTPMSPDKGDYTRFNTAIHVKKPVSLKAEGSDRLPCRIITLIPDSLLTDETSEALPVEKNVVQPLPQAGIAKLCVIERHHQTGNTGVGFVSGFSFTTGAVASTVAHDSHNIIVLGYSDELMLRAVELIEEHGGGMAAVTEQEELCVPFRIGGLMSDLHADEVIDLTARLELLTREMGFSNDPFPTLSFLALPVIPSLKLTDKGLVDVGTFSFVPLQKETDTA